MTKHAEDGALRVRLEEEHAVRNPLDEHAADEASAYALVRLGDVPPVTLYAANPRERHIGEVGAEPDLLRLVPDDGFLDVERHQRPNLERARHVRRKLVRSLSSQAKNWSPGIASSG